MNTLVLLLALAAAPHIPPSLDLSGGSVSPVASLIAWDKGGSQDWGTGIRSPDIDCAAVGTSSVASLQCSGATPSFAGPVQTAAGSPWWYRWDSAVRPSIVLNGSTDYWDLGDVDLLGDWTACALVSAAGAGNGVVVGKYKIAAYQWAIRAVNGSYAAVAWNAAGEGNTLLLGTIVPGSWTVLCASYVRTTQALIGSMNGTASGPITSGATENVTTALRIGNGETAARWPGGVHRVAIWDGTAFTAAQLAQLVATQWGLAADKPSGTVATHARTDSALCCPFSDAECYWVGPGAPCIHAPTYAGWASGGAVAGGIEVYGAGANALTYSEAFENAAWVKSAGMSAADASASCPLGPTGVRMSLVTTDSDLDQIAQDAATTPGRSVWMARATGDSACGVTFADNDGTGAQSVPLTDGPVRYYSGGTGQTGLSVARPAGGCARWCMWAAQAQAVTYPVPYRTVVAGTPYSGAGSTATTLTVPVALTDPARWAISFTGTKGSATSSDDAYVFSLGAGATNWAYMHGGFFGVLDASGAQTYVPVTGGIPQGPAAILASYTAQTLGLTVNGASRAGTQTTAGVGLTPMPTTLYVGNHYVATGKAWGGLVSRLAQCRRASGCR